MISPTATKDAFRQSAIRFLACIASLSVAGLALVITHPSWWPVSLVTVGSVPLLYHLAGPRRFRGGADWAVDVLSRLERRGYGVWHDVVVGDQVISHVIAGPAGVFAVTRSGWSGRLRPERDGWLDHARRDAGELLWEATRNAVAVKSRLRQAGLRKVPVHAVVALTRARITQASIDLGQAVFVRMAGVPSYVLAQTPSLTREQVSRAIGAFGGEEPTERSRPGPG